MDLNKLGLHIHELRNQFNYIEGNIGILNQALEKSSNVGVFMALQSIFLSTMQISRIVWAPRKKGKNRAEEIRKFLGIPEEHPLNNKDIQTLFDNCDEANEEWIKKTAGQYILYDYIGDLGESQHKDVEIDKIFRSFDTKGKIYVYRGVGFQMDSVMTALKSVSDAVNKAHYHLFPEQWKDSEGNAQAPAEADKAASKPSKKNK
ncbi:MAG: hypothetical protein HOJ34_04840 [Kordiimonadaceae bacterium]|jgi:hypothetical protein|nr:hypothetical protein [Kordiimonadaceae bacterium]MBT6036142.1 hypothetical protein [Kordiimonadaceae bacterium]MBT6329091.1 hypothetical protein [Kordiimonadaceae bacterium]MBT7583537.1 hypothetical protein [Kordiimonadaceae bacterium]